MPQQFVFHHGLGKRGLQRLQLDGQARQLQIDQTIRAAEVEVPAPTLHDLRADLERAGYAAWLDTAEIEGGASWSRAIEEAIEGCQAALVIKRRRVGAARWLRRLTSGARGTRGINVSLSNGQSPVIQCRRAPFPRLFLAAPA